MNRRRFFELSETVPEQGEYDLPEIKRLEVVVYDGLPLSPGEIPTEKRSNKTVRTYYVREGKLGFNPAPKGRVPVWVQVVTEAER